MKDADGFELEPPPKLKEADVLRAVEALLRHHGWAVRRMFPGVWVPYFEFANAKRMKRRPVPRTLHPNDDPDLLCVHPRLGALWVEVKAPGKKPNPAQAVKLEQLRREGYRAWWVDSVDEAKRLYLRAFA